MSLLERLNTVHQIFLDTAPVIYFVEKNPSFAPKVQPVFDRLDDSNLIAVVSPITLAECLVLPYKLGKPEVAQIFTDLLVNSQNVLFYPVDETTAEKAAELRARYNLTLTDAFQVAIAIQAGCDAFLTNDIELKRVTDIPVLVVSE
jgi:predicted nucleic acid-binding protein